MSVPGSSDLDLFSTYDALNRLVRLRGAARAIECGERDCTSGPTSPVRTTTWEYDLAGRTRAQDLANGTRIVNTHDAQGRLTAPHPVRPGERRPPRSQPAELPLRRHRQPPHMSEQYAGQATARTVTNTYDAALRLDTEQITEADGVSTLSRLRTMTTQATAPS